MSDVADVGGRQDSELTCFRTGLARVHPGYDPAAFPVRGVLALATTMAETGDGRRVGSAKRFWNYVGWSHEHQLTGTFNSPHPTLSHADRLVGRCAGAADSSLLSAGSCCSRPLLRDYGPQGRRGPLHE